METFLLNLLKTSLLGSLAILAMLVLKPLWRERYRAKTRCWLWLALAVFLLLPVDFSVKNAPVQAEPPKDYTLFVGTDKTAIQSTDNLFGDMAEKSGQSPAAVRDTIIQRPVTNPKQKTTRYIPVTTILFYGYLAGAAAFLLYQGGSYALFRRTVRRIVEDFDALPLAGEGTKPRVGVVGEILVKFHPTANNQIVDVIEREGCEAVVPGLIEFFLFGVAGGIFQKDPLGRSSKGALGSKVALSAIKKFRAPVNKALAESSRFNPPANIYELAEYASEILSLCNSMGEGWLLTAEMLELIHSGTNNIVCTQPFGCLPNHIVGKGMVNKIRALYPSANITPIDYDPSATKVNQENRIKLMLAVAKERLNAPAEAKPLTAEEIAGGAPKVGATV